MDNLEMVYNRMKEKYPKLYKMFTESEGIKTDKTWKCEIVRKECKGFSLSMDDIDSFLEELNKLDKRKETVFGKRKLNIFNDDGYGSRKLRCTWNKDHYQLLSDVGFS